MHFIRILSKIFVIKQFNTNIIENQPKKVFFFLSKTIDFILLYDIMKIHVSHVSNYFK